MSKAPALPAADPSPPFIVVGLDDSPSAHAALRFAADYARLSGVQLRAVHVSSMADQVPVSWSPEYVGYLDVLDPAALRTSIRSVFDSVSPDLGWRLDFVDGGSGQTLVERSATAMLLVVGTREHTGLGRILSGSVSHFCLSHSSCPVVAVPVPTLRHPLVQAAPVMSAS